MARYYHVRRALPVFLVQSYYMKQNLVHGRSLVQNSERTDMKYPSLRGHVTGFLRKQKPYYM
jgi:hypothetical protein